MRILKYLLLLIVVFIVGILAYIGLIPSEYDFERSRIIKAPANYIYKYISDSKKTAAWSPWQEDDPTMTFAYHDQTSGIGSSYSWNGAFGSGNLKTIEALDNKSLKQELQCANSSLFKS